MDSQRISQKISEFLTENPYLWEVFNNKYPPPDETMYYIQIKAKREAEDTDRDTCAPTPPDEKRRYRIQRSYYLNYLNYLKPPTVLLRFGDPLRKTGSESSPMVREHIYVVVPGKAFRRRSGGTIVQPSTFHNRHL
jgi:hypothetical protein